MSWTTAQVRVPRLAAATVAKFLADGYTLYFTDVTTHAINASLYTKLPFDSVQDFSQVAMVAQTPLILIAHPSLPAKFTEHLRADIAKLGKLGEGRRGPLSIEHATIRGQA